MINYFFNCNYLIKVVRLCSFLYTTIYSMDYWTHRGCLPWILKKGLEMSSFRLQAPRTLADTRSSYVADTGKTGATVFKILFFFLDRSQCEDCYCTSSCNDPHRWRPSELFEVRLTWRPQFPAYISGKNLFPERGTRLLAVQAVALPC